MDIDPAKAMQFRNLPIRNEWVSSYLSISEGMVMTTLYTRRKDSSVADQVIAMTVHLLDEDEAHQDQMRRLRNARASQRAARQQWIKRTA